MATVQRKATAPDALGWATFKHERATDAYLEHEMQQNSRGWMLASLSDGRHGCVVASDQR